MKRKKHTKKDVLRCIAFALAVVFVASICAMFSGCGNMSLIDTTWSFERAIIFLPDGEKLEGAVTSWNDYDGSDMIQVAIDGKTYLTHSSNVVMISE